MGCYSNSATGHTSQNGVHQQRFIGSLRDSRPFYNPKVEPATLKIAPAGTVVQQVKDALALKAAGDLEACKKELAVILRNNPDNFCA